MDKIKENKNIVIGAVAVLVVAIVIFFFMKGGKKLTCTMNESQSGMSMTSKITVKFNGDKAKSVKANMSVDFGKSSQAKSMAKLFKSEFEDEAEDVKKAGGKATIKVDGGKVTLDMSAENKGLSSVTGSSKESYKEIKKSLESAGYSCK